jgi:hypothetical protein
MEGQVSAHIGFLIAGVASLLMTLPIVAWGWARRVPSRHLAVGYYAAGYLVMAAGYTLDSVTNPPLFMHGFIAGVGAAQVILGLALLMV